MLSLIAQNSTLLPTEFGPYLNSDVAVHSPKSAADLKLGEHYLTYDLI